jgi:SNF2 family DNA or RNA helicase
LQTLNLLQALCKRKGYNCLRIDGATPAAQRDVRMKELNDRKSSAFVLLLSMTLGIGLNLIGANRLVRVCRRPPPYPLTILYLPAANLMCTTPTNPP